MAQSTFQASTALNQDLLESVLSVSESGTKIGAAAQEGIRAFVEAASVAHGSPGLDELPVRDGKSSLKTRKASAAAASASKAAGKARGSGQDTVKKVEKRDIPLGKLRSDQVDQIYEYERENLALKSKQNLLEDEIEKMKTKLARIDGLMARTSKAREGGKTLLPAQVQRHLQDEVDKLTSENEQMRDKNKKLRAIEKELTAKNITKKASANKYSHVKGKLASANAKQSEKEFEKLLEELKVQLIAGEKQIMHLTTQRELLQARLPKESQTTVEAALEAQQRELAEVSKRIAEIRSGQADKEAMFSNTKDLMEKKRQEIQELNEECERLTQRNYKAKIKADAAKDLKDRLKAVEGERD